MSVAARMPRQSSTIRGAMVAAASLGLLFLTAVASYGADDSKIFYPGGTSQTAAPVGGTGGTFNTITLFLALLLAVAGGWMFWKNRRTPGLNRENRALAIDETKSLGNRQYLVVASYEGQKFLLGVCPGRIEMLTPLHGKGESEGK